jgi:hypothetical protein
MCDTTPPAGTGNPLGMAGSSPRLGPCQAGRLMRRPDPPWDRPCVATAERALIVTDEEDPTETIFVPLCEMHMSALEAEGVV